VRYIILTDQDLINIDSLNKPLDMLLLSEFYINQQIINRAEIIVYVGGLGKSKVYKFKTQQI